ncbi:hypothetical protein F2P81_022053 [Scophthalmus maximus]|uniref:LRRCT domain-containing protein n=1 Tax=Scophthalmus maximus TaxID=52904 RepID=A0A6A4S1B2_SCOMX|nr:hypothetical protein F2P81_022053 [Scophthalmus maximus]
MRAETDNLHRFGCRWLQYERQPDGGVGGGRRETWPAEYQSMSRRILLADALSKTHVGDGELSYKGLGLKLDSAESVEELVREIEQYQGLRALRLEGNTVGVEAARAIAKALESKDLLQRCLGSALISAGARLTELDLSDNAFGPDGVKGIEQLLKSPSCFTLRELRLNNCGLGIGGGKVLAEALIDCHRQSSAHGAPLKLRVFIAGRNRLENEGAGALAKAFQLMGSLEEVHMPQNGINHTGVTALASAMRHNPELCVLNFNDNSFTKKGTLAMAQALRHLRNVQVINFGDCLVRSEGAIALAAVLREGLPILKELNLSFGEITEAAALVMAQAVMDKPHMEKVDLNEIMSFLSCPSVEKLLQLGEMRTNLLQQVDASDPHKAADVLLKIASLYNEEPETKTAVLETIDDVLKKLLSGSALHSYCFLSTLLVMMGLLKGEGKIKKVSLVPGQLLCLEHAVQQNYFAQHHALLLHNFMSKHTPYLTHLSLQRCNIRRVKEGAFRGLGRLVFLNLANNNIEILYQESFDGLSSLKQLMIDRNRVEEIQPGAFSQLGFLNLLSITHNQLVYIPNMAFQGLQNIKWLRLSHNSLNYLDTEAFAGLFTLNRLSLDHNEIQFFPTETMTRLPEVTRLDLSYNPMTYLGEDVVSMAKLTQLFLDHMSLQDMANTAISKSPSLTHLDISYNQLRVIQPFSEGSPKLARLNLAGNPIYCNCYLRPLREWAIRSKVKLMGTCGGPAHLSGENLEAVHPPELRCQSQEAMLKAEFEEATRIAPPPTEEPENKIKCPVNCVCEAETQHSSCENRSHTKVPRGFAPNTRLLDLRGNHFHYISSNSFPGVAQVVSLHLQRCKIVEVEGGAFSGMKGLIYLYLSENDLTSLSPDAFKGLSQLTYLHLEKNRFTSFPKEAFKLVPSLLALHLENNAITKLEPGILTGAEGLRALYLTGNAIGQISPRALDQGNDLDTLHLGGNKLKDVPTEALGKVGNLRDLRLSGNSIRWVGPNAFRPLERSLKELYLDNMGLEKMSQNSLAGLGAGLRSLFLEGNQLEEVPDLHPLTSLEVINLADNPLMCDCPLLPLRLWIEKVNLKVRATCANPPEMRGRRVKDVHVFKACPGGESLPSTPTVAPKSPKAPKATKPKPMHLNKMLRAKSRLHKSPTAKQAAAKKTKRRSMA